MNELILVFIMALITFVTRALPFVLFDHGDHPPKAVLYLGRVLPPAVLAMLIIFFLKVVSFLSPGGWLPALLSCVVVILLHLWKNNDLISIFGGTILYMILIQAVFV